MKLKSMKVLLFLSSYYPLYMMLLVLNGDQFPKLAEFDPYAGVFLAVMAVLIGISFLPLILIGKGKNTKTIETGILKKPDDTVVSYIMTYIVPILMFDFQDPKMVTVNIILFMIIGCLYVRLNLVYINPLLAIFGYVFYHTDKEQTIISNIPYYSLKNMKTVEGFFIANHIFIAKEKENLIE